MFGHYIQHFQAKINIEIIPKLPTSRPFQCPNCKICISAGRAGLLNHFLNKHEVMKNYIDEAVADVNKLSKKSKQTAVPQNKSTSEGESEDDVFKRASDILQKVKANRKARSLRVNTEASEKDKSTVSQNLQKSAI